MNNILEYYYNLKNIEIIKLEDNYLIFDENNKSYLFIKYNSNININNILNIENNIKNSKYFSIIKNINNLYITIFEKDKYVLLLTKGILNEELHIYDLVNNNKKYLYLNENNKYDLVDLWSRKIDYLEYQVSELSKEKKEIVRSFSYFVGMAENAISFININNINFNNIRKSIQHYRIKNNIIVIDYYNILNTLIDYQIRDYTEYLKSKIYNNEDILKDLKYILNNANLNEDEIKLLYARMLFPTYYFDDIEDILLDIKEEKEIEKYVSNINNYLNALNDIYLEIKKRISIDIPSWIKSHN